jgi:hypothetical protein
MGEWENWVWWVQEFGIGDVALRATRFQATLEKYNVDTLQNYITILTRWTVELELSRRSYIKVELE